MVLRKHYVSADSSLPLPLLFYLHTHKFFFNYLIHCNVLSLRSTSQFREMQIKLFLMISKFANSIYILAMHTQQTKS